jgi:hypothetical protein
MSSPPAAIRLSRRQVERADRIGGIELMIPWPAELREPRLADDHECEANAREKRCAEDLVRASCAEHGLVPVHVRVARLPQPAVLSPTHEYATVLAVTIIGHRWVHASTRGPPHVMWHIPD